ncbi:hypothetical protein [Planomonospora alba]
MGSNDTKRTGSTVLFLIGIIWLVGTPLMLMLTFMYGFALIGGEPRNAQLSDIFGIAFLVLGLGAPVVGFLTAFVMGNKTGVVVYGLIAIIIGAVLLRSYWSSKLKDRPVYRGETPVCTASLDRASGVPGCQLIG